MQYRIRNAKRILKEYDHNVRYITFDIRVDTVHQYIGYESDYGDNIILSYVLLLREDCPGDASDLVVYTDDVLLQQKLKSKDIKYISTEEIYNQEDYSGIKIFQYDKNNDEHAEILSQLYSIDFNENIFDLNPNEYLLVLDNGINNEEDSFIDAFRFIDGSHESITKKRNIMFSSNNDGTFVKPLNHRQSIAINSLNDDSVPVKIVKGKVASGKSYLTFTKAKELLDKQIVNQIIFIGNSVTEKSSISIGALPGELQEKIGFNYSYIADVLGSKYLLEEMIRTEQLCIEYCGFIRSRTFSNAAVVVSEAQNFTMEQLELILTRIGEGSYLIIDGDYNQSDIHNSGFKQFTNKLKGSELVSVITLTDVERSDVAKLADLLKG
jgi:phosphate starvation-inducible PhoH-like protein